MPTARDRLSQHQLYCCLLLAANLGLGWDPTVRCWGGVYVGSLASEKGCSGARANSSLVGAVVVVGCPTGAVSFSLPLSELLVNASLSG